MRPGATVRYPRRSRRTGALIRNTRPLGKYGDHSGGEEKGDGRCLEPAAPAAPAVSSTAAAISPSSATAVEPSAAVVAVVAPVVPAAVVAAVAAAEEAEVARAGARARVGPAPATTAVAAAAEEVRDDAEDYAYRDHEQGYQKHFHGTTLPVDVPGCKVVLYPYASLGYNFAVWLCVRARVVY